MPSLLEGLVPSEAGPSHKHSQYVVEYVWVEEGTEGREVRTEYEPQVEEVFAGEPFRISNLSLVILRRKKTINFCF